MSLNKYQWPNERGKPKKVGGKLEHDVIPLLNVTVDAMSHRLVRLNEIFVSSNAPSHHVKYVILLII